MKTSNIFCFLFAAFLTVSQAIASDRNFTEAAIWCEPIALGGDSEYTIRLTVLANIDVPTQRLSGKEVAIALLGFPGSDETFMALIGQLVVSNGHASSFASKTNDWILEVEFRGGRSDSKIIIKELEDGKWVELYNGSATCFQYQAGSEGIHN